MRGRGTKTGREGGQDVQSCPPDRTEITHPAAQNEAALRPRGIRVASLAASFASIVSVWVCGSEQPSCGSSLLTGRQEPCSLIKRSASRQDGGPSKESFRWPGTSSHQADPLILRVDKVSSAGQGKRGHLVTNRGNWSLRHVTQAAAHSPGSAPGAALSGSGLTHLSVSVVSCKPLTWTTTSRPQQTTSWLSFSSKNKVSLRRSLNSRMTRPSTCLRFADEFTRVLPSSFVVTVFKEGHGAPEPGALAGAVRGKPAPSSPAGSSRWR